MGSKEMNEMADAITYELRVDGVDIDRLQVLDALAMAGLTLRRDETGEASNAYLRTLGG